MEKRSLISVVVVGFMLFPGVILFSQENQVQQIVESIQSQIIERDSTLSDYTVLLDMTMLNYKKDPPEVQFAQQQKQEFRDGKLVEAQGTGDTTSVSSESASSDSTGNSQRMSMTDPLYIFKFQEKYTFSLKNSPVDSLIIIQVEPKNPSQDTYKGTFTLGITDWDLRRAELTPAADIPHVKSMETTATFTEFDGFPVTKTIKSRFQGKYLLVLSFDMGLQVEMKYADLD